MNRNVIGMALVVGAAVVGGCASDNERVTRVDPIKDRVDVSSRFNATDAHIMSEELVNDLLAKPWIANATAEAKAAGQQDPRPIVVLGTVRNETDTPNIDMEMVTNQVQEELLNSQRARVVSARTVREELRAERFDTEFADPATVLKKANEKKARFMILGRLLSNTQPSGDGRTIDRYFELRLEMTDMETTEKVWIRTARVRKIGER